MVLFVYGKRQERMPQLVVGALLMVYPYFVGDVTWMLSIGGVLLGALTVALRSGM